MADEPQPLKIPLIFFQTPAGAEPVREWLRGLEEAERQAIGKDLLRAQWRWPVGMPLPTNGKRAMGNPDGSADETDRARDGLLLSGALGGVARVHQEDSRHTG